mmetsp:Transcript_51725/g.136744  ORF Transcript_51725/g.136744 Transcript_51725/m.136744 type:complete len:264 (-) Transcript_51725:366-1157(-)
MVGILRLLQLLAAGNDSPGIRVPSCSTQARLLIEELQQGRCRMHLLALHLPFQVLVLHRELNSLPILQLAHRVIDLRVDAIDLSRPDVLQSSGLVPQRPLHTVPGLPLTSSQLLHNRLDVQLHLLWHALINLGHLRIQGLVPLLVLLPPRHVAKDVKSALGQGVVPAQLVPRLPVRQRAALRLRVLLVQLHERTHILLGSRVGLLGEPPEDFAADRALRDSIERAPSEGLCRQCLQLVLACARPSRQGRRSGNPIRSHQRRRA